MSVQLIKDTFQPIVDVANVVGKVQVLVPSLPNVLPAYLALSDNDKEELKKWFEANFDLIDNSVEKTIETGVKCLVDVQPAVIALKDGISFTDVFTLLAVLKQIQSNIGQKA